MAESLGSLKRTHYCGVLTEGDIGKRVCVMGWVQRRRDLGSLLFIDLRDRTGLVQLAFDEQSDPAVREKGVACRSEYVVAATGVVRERQSKNPEPADRQHRGVRGRAAHPCRSGDAAV